MVLLETGLIPIVRILQIVYEIPNQAHVLPVDSIQLSQLFLVLSVVRQIVIAIRDIRSGTSIVGELLLSRSRVILRVESVSKASRAMRYMSSVFHVLSRAVGIFRHGLGRGRLGQTFPT